MEKEATFFKEIVPKIRELVTAYHGKASISVQKTSMDYATEVDIAVENLIVSEIEARFPRDQILAEEGHSDTAIPSGRIWIIDPICGTSNIGRGLTCFCTNIALADSGQLIASCVIDHTQDDYFWSVGENTVYINNQKYIKPEKNKGLGVVIDVDMGSVKNVGKDELAKYNTFLDNLMQKTEIMPMSLNSSLGFAYSAIGKLDGFINIYNHPWDICASAFLIQQVGGVVTDIAGEEWHLEAGNAIGAAEPTVHAQILKAYLNN